MDALWKIYSDSVLREPRDLQSTGTCIIEVVLDQEVYYKLQFF